MEMRKLVICMAAATLLGACGSDKDNTPPEPSEEQLLTQALRQTVSELGLRGDPSEGRTLPTMENNPKAELGMQLFFTKALSGEMDTACVTCHHPLLGGGDDLSLPIGVEAVDPDLLGPGREHSSAGSDFDGGPTVPRNAPTTFNIALWDRSIFHDSRIESLEATPRTNGEGTSIVTPDSVDRLSADTNAVNLVQAQTRFPVTSNEEMKGHHKGELNNAAIRAYLVTRLRGDNADLTENQWLEAFRLGLGQPEGTAEALITEENLFGAIAEYERSQVFVDTPWRDFVKGDDAAITFEAKQGAQLFFASQEQGGADCASCHRGDFFTDERHHNIALPQLGRGKGDGADGSNDFGRFRVSKEERDRFAFRTPTLLNVTETAPYGHSGAFDSLRDMVKHHLNAAESVANYQQANAIAQQGVQGDKMLVNTQAALDKLLADRTMGAPVLQDVALTEAQVDQLLAFLATLTDRCVLDTACLAKWIPSDTTTDPDSMQLHAKFE
ncbi:cytochrome-c peroxidase [Shewanella cyperi]|uniref:Cytochrome-c peroxidase n=1 Tax=Shewanella cyperi TaxID=2814292 RepID=A0A975ALH8_9GAMM|nr:cytochrome c peroxidase [Shewanella cyperi]QSX30422.1 cytochrome-c peroxidase [Shewanella cyperi]